MTNVVVISHPEVIVDPEQEITRWDLSDTGRQRAAEFACSDVLARVTRIWSSTETKALETAELLSVPQSLPVATDAHLGENDRSATGFLPPAEFEAAADAFFAHPDDSFRGWERAIDAQERIHAAFLRIVAQHDCGDLAIVTHGAVGTLLWCRLSGLPIDRSYDQPGQGHFWSADLATFRSATGWKPFA